MADIISLEEYKTAKSITTEEYDARLTPIIAGVNKFIESYTKRIFGPARYTEKRRGIIDREGKIFLQMKQSPVTFVESLKVKYFGVQQEITLDREKIDLFEEGYGYYYAPINNGNIILRNEYRENFSYTVIYSGGEAVPADVKLAAIQMTSNAFEYLERTHSVASGTENASKLRRIDIGDYSEWYSDTDKLLSADAKENGMMITQTVAELLKPYRRQGQSGW